MDEGQEEEVVSPSDVDAEDEQDAPIAAHEEAATPGALSIVNKTVEVSNDTMDEGQEEEVVSPSNVDTEEEHNAPIAAHGEAAAPASVVMDDGKDTKAVLILELKMLMRSKRSSKLNKTNALVKLTDPTRKTYSTGACFTDTFFASEYAIIIDRGSTKKKKMEERANAQIEHLIHLAQHGMDSDTIHDLHTHLQE